MTCTKALGEDRMSWEEPQGGWGERVGDGHGGRLE